MTKLTFDHWTLTTEHPASSYGVPVLIGLDHSWDLTTGEPTVAQTGPFGPTDIVTKGWAGITDDVTAADIVSEAISRHEQDEYSMGTDPVTGITSTALHDKTWTPEQRQFAEKFLLYTA